jgi:hypothetical protein
MMNRMELMSTIALDRRCAGCHTEAFCGNLLYQVWVWMKVKLHVQRFKGLIFLQINKNKILQKFEISKSSQINSKNVKKN